METQLFLIFIAAAPSQIERKTAAAIVEFRRHLVLHTSGLDKLLRPCHNVQEILCPEALSILAELIGDEGRWNEAEELHVQVIEMATRTLGREHPSTLRNMAGLGWTHMEQGRWKEAEKSVVQVMKTSARVLGQEQLDTLRCMDELVSVYREHGLWKKAEKLGAQVVKTRVLGPEHEDTLICTGSLASVYLRQGRWKKAEHLDLQVMKTSARVLGSTTTPLTTWEI